MFSRSTNNYTTSKSPIDYEGSEVATLDSPVGEINSNNGDWEDIDREENKVNKPALENLVEAKD